MLLYKVSIIRLMKQVNAFIQFILESLNDYIFNQLEQLNILQIGLNQ
ncbi:MAG: hypothetical protein ACI8ZX_001263 [Planctomycetota bacterium]|jgi:hypothetical protein